MKEVVTTASLDGARIIADWAGDELLVRWLRFGQTLAGIVLSEEHVKELASILSDALDEREKDRRNQ